MCPLPDVCLPPAAPYGNFTVGLDYAFDYIIDVMKVTDNLGETIVLPEAVFLSCFENLGEAVTSFSPIHSDTTVHHLYMVLRGDDCSLEEIKAYAKVMKCELSPGKTGIDAEAEPDCGRECL